jgi:hypothetical protein
MRYLLLSTLMSLASLSACGDTSPEYSGGQTPDSGNESPDSGGIPEPECRTDANCGAAAYCSLGRCISNNGAPCAGDDECGRGRCVEGLCDASANCEEDSDCERGLQCRTGHCTRPPPRPPGSVHRFVLIEDLSDDIGDPFPGADIDTIILTKSWGGRYFVTAVEDGNIPAEGNSAADPTQAIGEPDTRCEDDSGGHVSMGGQAADGWLIVSFGTATEDVTIENGDSLRIFELGQTICGKFRDDPLQLSVGTQNTRGSFTAADVIATTGNGSYDLVVSGL